MVSAFLIPFRESLEAGVVVGILTSILHAFHAAKAQKYVWAGVGMGVLFSLVFAWVFNAFMGGFSGATEKIYEGALMFFACGLITHMVFWMKAMAHGLRERMTDQVEGILKNETLYMLSFIAFAAVVREGVETVIFFQAMDISSGATGTYGVALLGVLSAVFVSYLLYTGSTWLNAKTVFQTSGMFLIFIAAGLLAHGIVELQGAGVLPIYIKPLFDLSNVLSESEGLGAILKAIFGYDANPSLMAVVAYVVFLPVTIWQYTRTRV